MAAAPRWRSQATRTERALSHPRFRGASACAATPTSATSRSAAPRARRSAPRNRSAAARRAASRRVSARPRTAIPRARPPGRWRSRAVHALFADAGVEHRARLQQPIERQARELRCVGGERVLDLASRARPNGAISVGNGRSAHTPQSHSGGAVPGCASSARRPRDRRARARGDRHAGTASTRARGRIRRSSARAVRRASPRNRRDRRPPRAAAAERRPAVEAGAAAGLLHLGAPALVLSRRPRPQATFTTRQPASRNAISVAGIPAISSSGCGERWRTVRAMVFSL